MKEIQLDQLENTSLSDLKEGVTITFKTCHMDENLKHALHGGHLEVCTQKKDGSCGEALPNKLVTCEVQELQLVCKLEEVPDNLPKPVTTRPDGQIDPKDFK